MQLFPAIKVGDKVIKGQSSDSHNTLAASHGYAIPAENNRIFTPDGKLVLTRKQALGWLKANDIKAFRKLPGAAHYKGLHSEHLAKAYGITQKEESNGSNDTVVFSGTKENIRSDGENSQETLSLAEKTAIVYDRGGLYLYCAEKLAESYGKVMYYLADSDAYPTSQKHTIGAGIPKVKRIHDFWKHLDKADIIYFFDCYDGELQHWLRSKGYLVFGSGRGEAVEIDKIKFLELLEELELPCPLTYLAEGMDDLCEYLKEHDGETLYLKNLHRGDFESRKFTSMAQSRPFLNDLKKRLGSASDTLEVLVQHKIDAECEVGYDGFLVDGEYTSNCVIGYEIKDKGFVGKVFKDTPEVLKGINDAFSGTFKELGYRGNYSTEVRITKDGQPYYIDATCRVPSPPGEILCELYENWAEATWDIANGLLPELEPKAEYCASVILISDWHNDHELHVKFPKRYKQNIKLKNHTVRDGEHYCIPNGNGGFFGAVVVWADNLEDAIEECCVIAKLIEADEFSFDDAVFDEAKKQIESGEAFGVEY